MSRSIFSFVMSVAFGTGFILVLHILCRRERLVRRLGAGTFLALYALCMLRFVLVTELPFTTRLQVQGGLSGAYMKMTGTRGVSIIPMPLFLRTASFSPIELLCIIWAGVAAVLILRLAWQNIRLSRRLARYAEEFCPDAERTLALMKRRVWWEPKVRVCVCPDIDIPMGAGLFRKYICLPEEPYTQDELYYIIRHEYTHFCSRDIAWKLLARVFCSIFWWDPAVWLMKKDIDRLLELRCDQRATRTFDKRQRLAYLSTIIRLLGDGEHSGSAAPAGTAGLFRRDGRRDVKERFTALTQPKASLAKGRRWALTGLAALALALSYAFILRPTGNVPAARLYQEKYLGPDYEVIRVTQDWTGGWTAYADTGYFFAIDEDTALACEERGVPTYRDGLGNLENRHYFRLPFNWGWIEWEG